ncbi:MAG: sterol desaturase family protein, partial [Flavobacteriaceae bacterium]|nr:sterol desaturase family protein [Flavobacteriaceae bacterium]
LDRNHAGILIIWDRIFGTFESEVEKPVYGLVTNIKTYNPIKIAFIEWINMLNDAFTSKTSIINKFKYFIKPPGWKHDGSSILSSDLRKDWEKTI